MMKRIALVFAALSVSAFFCYGQRTLPLDPAVRYGHLENGLTYYIRHNDKPADRCEFYLATNAGAIQEGPGQDGLAHFLEHMCFNGTKNFPEKSIINWLESIGASFGGNVNASTGVEKTTYMLTNIPLCRETVVDTCLLILHDYSHFVTLDPVEIDKERGVILEEKRSRNGCSWRMHERSLPLLFADTKYASCNIIGSQQTLETFRQETLADFYRTWYRPDMQAVVVVGDIDVDAVEKKIASVFADIPSPSNPRSKDVIRIPDNEKPVVGIFTDPEQSSTAVQIYWKRLMPPEEINLTESGLYMDMSFYLISSVMNERLQDISANPDAPFLNAGFNIGAGCRTMGLTSASVLSREGEALSAFEALMVEVEKMRRFGLDDAEISRAKTNLQTSYENSAKKASSRKNAELVHPLLNHFFSKKAYMDPQTRFEIVSSMLSKITAEDLSKLAASLFTDRNEVIIYQSCEKEGAVHPTGDQLVEVVSKVTSSDIRRSIAEVIPEHFLDPTTLKGAKVSKAKPFISGSEQIMLSNGVKVILLPTQYEKNKIYFNLYEKGGESLLDASALACFNGNVWNAYLENSGIGKFPGTMINKMLAGKHLSVSPFVSSYTHGINGSSSPKDFETALQILYLMFVEPRFDADEYGTGMKQLRAVLPNYMKQSDYAFQKAVTSTMYDSDRRRMLSMDMLDEATLESLENSYRTLFSGVRGGTFVVVGDFEKDSVMPIIARYVGSLPKGRRVSDWAYRGDGIVHGKNVCDFRTPMKTPKVTVAQIYSADCAFSYETQVAVSALKYITRMVYTETLRENEGGTYSPRVSSSVSKPPRENVVLEVMFETNEKSADKLRGLAIDALVKLSENGPTAVQFDKALKNLEKSIPESRINNQYWMSVLQARDKWGYDSVAEYEAAVKALTPEKVKAAAAMLVGSGNFIEIVMRPE